MNEPPPDPDGEEGRKRRSSWRAWLFSRPAFVEALATPPDHSVLSRRPTGRTAVGLLLVAVSYVVCWPFIAVLSAVAVYLRRPSWAVIGSPVLYVLSTAIFGVGVWWAGPGMLKYVRTLQHIGLRWLARALGHR